MAKGNGSTAIVKSVNVEDHLMDASPNVPEGFECQIVRNIPEGKAVKGEYLGPGAKIEMIDAGTGEVKDVPSVRLRLTGGLTLDIPESAQLSRLRNVAVGKLVCIARLGQVQTRGGRRCNEFKIDVETDAHFTARTGMAPAVASDKTEETLS